MMLCIRVGAGPHPIDDLRYRTPSLLHGDGVFFQLLAIGLGLRPAGFFTGL